MRKSFALLVVLLRIVIFCSVFCFYNFKWHENKGSQEIKIIWINIVFRLYSWFMTVMGDQWWWSFGSVNLNTFPYSVVIRATSFVLHILADRFYVQPSMKLDLLSNVHLKQRIHLFLFKSNWRKICRLIYEINIFKFTKFTYCAPMSLSNNPTTMKWIIFDYFQLFVPYVIQLSICTLRYYSQLLFIILKLNCFQFGHFFFFLCRSIVSGTQI